MSPGVTAGALGVGVSLVLLAPVVGQAPERFVQDRFAIGFWVDPPMDEKADERYREIAGAHFTLVLGGFGARTPEQVRRQLELCEQYGLRAIVAQAGLEPEELPDGPACWGYLLADEPHPSAYPGLRERLEAVRRARPGRLAYINLFPNYVGLRHVEADSYDEYVARFLHEVPVDVLSMDHYPLFKPGGDSRDNYCANLEVMRRRSLEEGIPFWNFFNAMPFGPHTDPTEAQIRWQVFTSLAYGARGVLYFCYYTPGGGEFPKGGALITRDDRRTNHWYQARRLNEQLKAMGPTLMALTSTGVYRVKPDDDPEQVLQGTPVKTIRRADVDPPLDLLVGVFRHADGRQAVLLNNYHFAYTAWPTMEFEAPLERITEVDPWSGRESALIDASPAMPGLQVSLEEGGGRLFLIAD